MMRRALVLGILLVIVGCATEEVPNYLVEYQIGMSSMEVVPPTTATEPLVVRLTGIVGPDTRYRFDHTDVVETADRFEMTIFGLRNDDPERAFIPALVEWTGREFQKQPPHGATIQVIVHQPDGTTLEETVAVGQGRAGT